MQNSPLEKVLQECQIPLVVSSVERIASGDGEQVNAVFEARLSLLFEGRRVVMRHRDGSASDAKCGCEALLLKALNMGRVLAPRMYTRELLFSSWDDLVATAASAASEADAYCGVTEPSEELASPSREAKTEPRLCEISGIPNAPPPSPGAEDEGHLAKAEPKVENEVVVNHSIHVYKAPSKKSMRRRTAATN